MKREVMDKREVKREVKRVQGAYFMGVLLSRLLSPSPCSLLCSLFFMGVLFSQSSPSWAGTVGKRAPGTVLESLQGGALVALDEMRGQVVLVDFWASWCPPCRTSLPLFNELRAELHHMGFEVLAINVDENKRDALGFFRRLSVQYPSGFDPKGRMAELWGVQAMPTSFLVDREGLVRWVHKGFKEKDMPLIKGEILKLLNESVNE